MTDRVQNPFPALRPGPVWPGPIASMSPWAPYGGGTYPGYLQSPCTMGGGIVPNLNDTCGWTYKQWGPGMGGTYPSYSYKGYFPRFVPGEGYSLPQGPVAVGVEYNAVAVGTEPTSDLEGPPPMYRPMLSSRFSRGRPAMGSMPVQATAPAPQSSGDPTPTPPTTDELAACPDGKTVECWIHNGKRICRCFGPEDERAPELGRALHQAPQTAPKKAPAKKVAVPAAAAPQRQPIIIDVRTREEAARLPTIPGAVNIPIQELPLRLRELVQAAGSPDTLVAIYCKLGRRAQVAKEFLMAQGFRNVENLGGTDAGPYSDVLSGGRPVVPTAVTQAQLAGAA